MSISANALGFGLTYSDSISGFLCIFLPCDSFRLLNLSSFWLAVREMPSMGLSGTLSPSIGNLTHLRTM